MATWIASGNADHPNPLSRCGRHQTPTVISLLDVRLSPNGLRSWSQQWCFIRRSFVPLELRMITLKPSLVVQSPAVAPSSYVQAARLERRPTPSYAHISFFRSILLDMQIYSPSIKVVQQSGLEGSQPRPVFGERDKIEGKVMLDPSCSQNGRLTITLEGTFEYMSVKNDVDEHSHNPTVKRYRSVFLSSSATIPIASPPEHRSTIREALTVRKRPSQSSLNNAATCRSCEFSFDIPRGSLPDEEIPPTFSCKTGRGDLRRQLRAEELDVAYRIRATWEPPDGPGKQVVLEVPIFIQPEADVQSSDSSNVEPDSWLEMPLIPERQIPFNCAVTLPRPHSFSRCSSIPYYVVFSTNARSPSLVREIAADASIVVSLVRKITIIPQRTPQQLPILPDTPPASDESDGQTAPFASRSRLLKRSIRSPSRPLTREESPSISKMLSTGELPPDSFSVLRTLQTEVVVGFPKRPRVMEPSRTVPDGLFKGTVQLSRDMVPSVDWPGISVKYYLDVSVLTGHDDVRARVPIKIY